MPRLPGLRLVAAGRAWWARSLGGRGYARMRELDLDTHALAFSAQQVLCTAPLLVAISAILDRFTGRDVTFVIARFFGLGHEATVAVGELFSHSSRRMSMAELVGGLVIAVLFTTSVATVQQRAFELIWTLPRVTSVRGYLRQLLYVPALALFIAALLLAGRLVRAMDATGTVLGVAAVLVLQAAIVFLFIWWSQHWLLGGRVEWRALAPGALVVAVLTVITVRLSRVIMDGQITWQVQAYGLVGVVFVMSVWLGIFSAVIFFGILAGAVWVERAADPTLAAEGEEISDSPLTVPGLISAADALDEPRAQHVG